ncbi:3-isopropylmalate dehydratase small subunit, partial [Dysosmobacter welbionis]
LLDLADQLLHVGAGGAAPVDDKARMLLADLGAAHRQPLQAALVDQRPGVIALRPLEGAARAGELQRLAGPALFQQLLHPAPDCRRVAGRQAELRPQHHRIRVIRQKAAAVAEGHLRPGEGPDALLRQQQGCLPHHLGHLPAVGAGIHAHRAAHRARDAVGEF